MSSATLPDLNLEANDEIVLSEGDSHSQVVPNLVAAEELMDWLEAHGHAIVGFDLLKPSGFMVMWR